MIQLIKKVLPKETTKFLSGQYQIAKWLKNGRPSPPPKIIKQKMANLFIRFNIIVRLLI